MTTGNGTANTVSATNAATASADQSRVAEGAPATRTTAWATMASTAGASPAKRAVTAVVSP